MSITRGFKISDEEMVRALKYGFQVRPIGADLNVYTKPGNWHRIIPLYLKWKRTVNNVDEALQQVKGNELTVDELEELIEAVRA